MPQFAITLDAERVTRTLTKAMAAVRDWTPAFRQSADEMLKIYGWDVFESQGPLGEAWAQLSEKTLKARARRWGYYRNQPVETDKILVWTGRLRAGFRSDVQPMQLRIYNEVDYFQYHQTGGDHLPKRRMLYLSPAVIHNIVGNMHRQFQSATL